MSRMYQNDGLRSVPPATLGILGLCGGVYAYQLIADPYLQHFTMNPRAVIFFHQFYRIVTSTLFHGSFLHIGMNAMSTLAISSLLEKSMGTIRHGLTILWAILLTSVAYILIAFFLQLTLGIEDLMYQHSLGFSGVIFHMSVLESNLSPHQMRSIFGFVTVPAYVYPWALLIALQFLLPNLSFTGHLAGILTGTLQLYGVFGFLMPEESFLQHLDVSLGPLVASMPSLVPTTSVDASNQRDPSALRRGMIRAAAIAAKFIRDVLETIRVIVFGRGTESNANIRLGLPPVQPPRVETEDFEDDDWVGLPSRSANV